MSTSMAVVEKFASLELLNDEVATTFNQYVASPQHGSAATMSAFMKWMHAYDANRARASGIVLIPSDPTSFLTFPTLRQEIEIARLLSDVRYEALSASQIAAEFDFNLVQLDQPIYSFSGGERVRAALLKANLLLPRTKQLVLCNPTHWLHLDSYMHLQRLIANAERLGVKVLLYLLEGDAWPALPSTNSAPISTARSDGPTWFLEANDFALPLRAASEGPSADDRILPFFFEDKSHEPLKSPTLLIGPNGAGKSLLAQCLGGLHSEHSKVKATSKHGAGPGRLVLQDALSQLFREKIKEHAVRVFDFDQEGMKRASALFKELSSKCRQILWTEAPNDPYLVGRDDEPDTLMQVKLMLASERLVYSPTVLILDEPAWGLSEKQANAFVSVVISHCHQHDIPVLIVCHAVNWLSSSPGTRIRITRRDSGAYIERIE